MKPDFGQMSLKELRTYVKDHRNDDEAIRELFVNRRSPDETATWYHFPLTPDGFKQGEEVMLQQIQQIEQRQE